MLLRLAGETASDWLIQVRQISWWVALIPALINLEFTLIYSQIFCQIFLINEVMDAKCLVSLLAYKAFVTSFMRRVYLSSVRFFCRHSHKKMDNLLTLHLPILESIVIKSD